MEGPPYFFSEHHRGFWPPLKQELFHLKPNQVTLNAGANATAVGVCSRIWDPLNARFESCSIAYIYGVPAVYSVLLLLALITQAVVPWSLPIWARNFVREEPEKSGDQDVIIPSRRVKWLGFRFALSFFSMAGLLVTLPAVMSRTNYMVTVPHAFSWGVTLLYVVAIRPRTVSALLFVSYTLILAAGLATVLNGDELKQLELAAWSTSIACAAVCIVIILLMPLRDPSLPADTISKPFAKPTSELRSPEDNLSLWQWMTVSWMKPMITQGKEKKLETEDVWSLGYEFDHSRLHEAFRIIKGSVFRRLMLANGIDLIITTLLGIIEKCGKAAAPVLLQQLLRSMENSSSSKRGPLVYALFALSVRLVVAQTGVFKLWYCRRVYERSRGELITMLYEKTLARKIIGESVDMGDKKDEKSASTGKVLNIMRGDAYEIAQRFWEWPDLFARPLGLVLSIVLICKVVGWPALLGAAVFLVFQGINIFVARVLVSYGKKRRAATDDKLKIITQFIEAIRHLRYNSWESKWMDSILSARQKELNITLITEFWSTLLSFLNGLASGLFPVFAFLAFTLLAGQKLRVDIAFPALQLFTMLETNLEFIPDMIRTLINAWVAMGRIEKFMAEPDKEAFGNDDSLLNEAQDIRLDGVSFAWPGLTEPVLKNLTMKIPAGMTVVHGKVGSGKTAFLQALLGELDLLSGTYTPPNAMIAYCGQTPWLQNMSIRDNILFGYPFDRERYKEVLSACALTTDLAEFTNGDLSFIGENGIGLSGGQKARVALARAVYSNSPYLFLDDPISALDQQTAEHVMRQCIVGPLSKDRSIILVTHRMDLVRGLAAKVIEIEDGNALIQDADLISYQNEEEEETAASSKDGEAVHANGDAIANGKAADDAADAVKDKFIEEEHRAHGGVKLRVYWEYIRAGKLWLWGILVLAIVLARAISVAEAWFLKAWGESYDRVAVNDLSDPFKSLPPPDQNIRPWLIGFSILAISSAVSYASFGLVMVFIVYYTGRNMFRSVMLRISNAAFRFYDVTPVGRLMNRMTSDIGTIDGQISYLLYIMGICLVGWLTSIAVIASVTPVFFLFALVITLSFVVTFSQFLPTSQNLRRLEMVSLSPLMANFGTLIEGLVTVRAFRAQRRFQAGVIQVVDTFQKMDHFYWSLQAWLMIRFDTLSALSTFSLTLLAIFTNVSPGLTAFVLNAANVFVANTHSLCRIYGRLELDFTSVERVVELLYIEQEPSGEKSPPAGWPTAGEIVFENVDVRYAPHLDLVLKDVDLQIPGGSNVALVGRTGSGKSTLALSLLATVRPERGRILLDGIDICTLKPAELRRRVTFLAQEPTLFVGTMRANLDPLDEFSDDECSSVLARLGGERYSWTLETHVEPGGRNLSQGQRQLVQLARAILRRSPLVILDEATASIDLGTSKEVQGILREEMSRSTVLTIAHRIEAVAAADWTIELSNGRVVAQGRPGSVERADRVDGAENGGGGSGSRGSSSAEGAGADGAE